MEDRWAVDLCHLGRPARLVAVAACAMCIAKIVSVMKSLTGAKRRSVGRKLGSWLLLASKWSRLSGKLGRSADHWGPFGYTLNVWPPVR